ncbi:MAG: hypothetical protein QGG24_07655 [Vicinamibacterales bacterium]|jgi:hypothetical protein|nr:hypothetical protein [Vicinamibacterales bacterium]MDP7472750.1 hypothetical protein [Vicinamibacterales bacterium]MDP7670871.1 hypothetical protein [Vicinamibacterales bacterium]HJO39616.1 hypothetical protein [Vicinamibacterales bacterium]|tara:strand:+ start:427 stop:579 length:153 start_codon:yes stop_codon:yes gene_type:complete
MSVPAGQAPDRQLTDSSDTDQPMASIYVAVLVVEAIVLAALWGFSQYFGA